MIVFNSFNFGKIPGWNTNVSSSAVQDSRGAKRVNPEFEASEASNRVDPKFECKIISIGGQTLEQQAITGPTEGA